MEKYIVITNGSGKDELEYIVEKETCDDALVFRLRHHESNAVMLKITDNGNGIFIDRLPMKMSYTEQYDLLILLDFINRKEHHPLKYRFVNDEGL